MNTTIECLTLTDLNNYMPYLIFWFILHILSFILAIFHIFGEPFHLTYPRCHRCSGSEWSVCLR